MYLLSQLRSVMIHHGYWVPQRKQAFTGKALALPKLPWYLKVPGSGFEKSLSLIVTSQTWKQQKLIGGFNMLQAFQTNVCQMGHPRDEKWIVWHLKGRGASHLQNPLRILDIEGLDPQTPFKHP